MINISLTDLLNAPDSAPVAPTRSGDAAAFTGLLDQFDSRQQAEAPAKARPRASRAERPAATRDDEPAKDTRKTTSAQAGKAKPVAAPARDEAGKADDRAETHETAAADKPAASDETAQSAADDDASANVDAAVVQAPLAAPIEEQPALQIAMTANSAATADDAISGVAAPTDQAANGEAATPLAAPVAESETDGKATTPATQPQTAKADDDTKPAQPVAAASAAATAQAADMTKRLEQMPVQMAVQVSGEDAGKPLKPLVALANGMSHPAQTDATPETQTASAAPATDGTAAPTTAAIDMPDAQSSAQALTQSATPAFASLVEATTDNNAPIAGKPVAGEPAAIGSVASSGPTAPASTVQSAAQAAKAAPLPHPATEQVAVHIAKASADGSDKINVKLKPASLGQVDVQLDIAADGRIQVVISADRADTLDLLQRDARGLERALNDAGLQMDQQSMSFNLRDQGTPQGNAGNGATGRAGWQNGAEGADEPLPAVGGYLNARAAVGGVDIRV